MALHGEKMQLDFKSKYILEDRTYLKLILGVLFLFYCYLSILPKHGDFYALNSVAQVLAKEHFDLSKIYINNLGVMHPPLFYLIDGVWIKLGSLLHIYNLDDMAIVDGQYANPFTQFWCMLPYSLILLACAVISYKTLNSRRFYCNWCVFL